MLGLYSTPIERATAGLVRNFDLEPSHARRICELDLATEHYPSGAEIGAADEPPYLKWILDGWACEARELADGRRQIFSFVLPGDLVRPPQIPGARIVRALTAVQCVDVGDMLAHGGVGETTLEALHRATAEAHARKYEHLSRLAWRSALSRMASLLVELHDRLDSVGLTRGREFALPLRHEELADALGLSAVHVTRCLGVLRTRGLMTLQFRRVSGFDRAGLQELCEG
jgi:CRP-like cAMP-binding protein